MSRATMASSVSPSAAVSVSSASRRGGAAGVCAAAGSTAGAPDRAAAAPTTPTCLNRLRRETCRLSSDPSGMTFLLIFRSDASRLFQDLSKSNAFKRILPCVGETLCRFWGGIAEPTRMCVNHGSAWEAHCPMIERLAGAERMDVEGSEICTQYDDFT